MANADELDKLIPGGAATRQNDAGAEQLSPTTFLRRVVEKVLENASPEGDTLNCHPRGRLAKFWYGEDGSIHYEIWIHERTNQLELGLHLESSTEHNRALYRAFDSCMLEIQNSLGSSFWLEEWDHGWVRLYETHPLFPLDNYRVDEIAERLGEIIETLQPIYAQISSQIIPPAR